MKYFYIVVQAQYGEKFFANVVKVSEHTNIYARLKAMDNVVTAEICPSQKAAKELASIYNSAYITNGVYLY